MTTVYSICDRISLKTMTDSIANACQEIDRLMNRIEYEQELYAGQLPVHIQELYFQLEKSRATLAKLKLMELKDGNEDEIPS